MTTDADLVEVRLLGLPLALHRQATAHQDELLREFTWIAQDDAEGIHVPARLLAVGEQLRAEFSAYTEGPTSELDQALAGGDEGTIDLVYLVPPAVASAAETLGAVLDEADEYCRRGDHLLTLATPAPVLAYRRWFLGEFVRQASGSPPRPWADEHEDAPEAPSAS